MNLPNYWLLAAGLVATAAVTLHVYTFEVWIWPGLKDIGFPNTRFGTPEVTKGFYRTVWHFFTVNWLVVIAVNFLVAFGNLIPYGMLLVQFLMVFWVLIVVEIFFMASLLLQPGQSYIKTMIKDFQWVIVVIMLLLMFKGSR